MNSKESAPSSERRSFLARLNGGAAALAAAAFGYAPIPLNSAPAARWAPARHEKDDWLDQLPGKHRVVFDTTNPEGLGEAILFAGNFLRVNRSDYGLRTGDLAVVMVLRHRSAPFGCNGAMWAKYGAGLAEHAAFEDPKSKTPPKLNVYDSGGYGNLLSNRGMTLESLAQQGVQIAVCASSITSTAAEIAHAAGGDARAIFSELAANLVNNGRIVPAGVVAVTRAQERGYALVGA